MGGFNESQHPRVPAGSPKGGEFASKGGVVRPSAEDIVKAEDAYIHSYGQMNNHLRNGGPTIYGKEIKDLKAAIATSPGLPQEQAVYRGFGGKTRVKLIDARVGDVLEDKGFGSASITQSVAAGFASAGGVEGAHFGTQVVARIKLPAGFKTHYISKFGEGEHIMPPGTRLKITRIVDKRSGSGALWKVYHMEPAE